MSRHDIYKRYLSCYLILLYVLNSLGCASVPAYQVRPGPHLPGIYHRIERGQTLWKISKIYNVNLDELASVNRIDNASSITTGQLIFIPGRQKIGYPQARYLEDEFTWPAKGKVVSRYGETYNNMVNKGIDIRPYGKKDIVASRSGKIVFYSGNFEGFGRTIIIEHKDGFLTVYSGISHAFIKPGDYVQKGSRIAEISDGNAYLHFEIRKGHLPQNPSFYLP